MIGPLDLKSAFIICKGNFIIAFVVNGYQFYGAGFVPYSSVQQKLFGRLLLFLMLLAAFLPWKNGDLSSNNFKGER